MVIKGGFSLNGLSSVSELVLCILVLILILLLLTVMRHVLIKIKENATKMHNVKHAMFLWLNHMLYLVMALGRQALNTLQNKHTHTYCIHTQFYWHLSHITYTLRESLRKSPLLLPTTSIYIPP